MSEINARPVLRPNCASWLRYIPIIWRENRNRTYTNASSVANTHVRAATTKPSRPAFTRNLGLRLGKVYRHSHRSQSLPGCHPFFTFCGVGLKEKRINPLVGMAGVEPATCWVVGPVRDQPPGTTLPCLSGHLSYIPTWAGQALHPRHAPVFPGCRRFAQSASWIVDGGLHRLAFRPSP